MLLRAEVTPISLADEAMGKQLFDDDVVTDEEAERKRAAEEMAKLRAPGAMCLKFLWEAGLETFRPAVERVLESTLAKVGERETSAAEAAGARGRRHSDRRGGILRNESA